MIFLNGKMVFFSLLLLFVACKKELPFYTAKISAAENNKALQDLARWATEEKYGATNGRVRTNAIIVLRNGKIELEAYASEFDSRTLHPTWSISKFLLNGALGKAVLSGQIDLDRPVRFYLKNTKGTFSNELKVKDLLFFASGLAWKERYEWIPFDSDILEILYGNGNSDMTDYIMGVGFSEKPGDKVSYSSGDSNLLSAVLASSLGSDFPNSFFHSIGIRAFVWETDGQSVPIASSYAYLSARDLAKIGKVYIREGWEKPSGIFPKNWIAETFRKHDAEKRPPWYLAWLPLPSMGGHVYLNHPKGETLGSLFPTLSPESFFASGHWGQYLIVDPKRKLVIVRLGNDRGGRFPIREFLERLLPVLDERDSIRSEGDQ